MLSCAPFPARPFRARPFFDISLPTDSHGERHCPSGGRFLDFWASAVFPKSPKLLLEKRAAKPVWLSNSRAITRAPRDDGSEFWTVFLRKTIAIQNPKVPDLKLSGNVRPRWQPSRFLSDPSISVAHLSRLLSPAFSPQLVLLEQVVLSVAKNTFRDNRRRRNPGCLPRKDCFVATAESARRKKRGDFEQRRNPHHKKSGRQDSNLRPFDPQKD